MSLTQIGITFNSLRPHSSALQRRGLGMDTLLFEYLCLASDWFKITMGHAEGSDWSLELCM